MKRGNVTLSAVGLVLALSMPSWAQQLQRTLPTQTVTLSGTVETIDRGKRVVNIKTPDGKFETVDVPPGAKRFDELKVGDKVSITFTGPNGWKYSRRVVDPTVLDKVKVGDQVDITWDTNVTVAVQ